MTSLCASLVDQYYIYCIKFDTLPIVHLSPADMEPGDLVFISGIYYSPKGKKSGWENKI